MRKLASLFFSVCICAIAYSQSILADIKLDYSQVQSSNTQVYQTLERSLNNFINSTKWTNDRLQPHERIEANFIIIISERDNNKFSGSIQVQSRRPVYNSTYHSPILNLNDNKFEFEYNEYEELIFNDRRFSGKNLTDVIAYYIYLILGYDADSFKQEGGTEYFKTAQRIANLGLGTRFSGWSELDGLQSRTLLANNILKPDNKILRTVNYQYHRNGLDKMTDNELEAKNEIGKALSELNFYTTGNFSQFYPLEIFTVAKKDEIGKIYSGGQVSTVNIEKIKEVLNAVSPKNSNIWSNLKK